MKNIKILLVDDEPQILEVNEWYIKESIPEMNIAFLYAANGKEAIEIFEQNDGIDLVMSDVQMPIMNGLDMTKKMRSLLISTPIILLSGSQKPSEEKLENIGVNGFISKPIERDKLAIMTKLLLDEA